MTDAFSTWLPPSGPPQTIGALEIALGIRIGPDDLATSGLGVVSMPDVTGVAPVTSLWARYRWDMFHENPVNTVEALRARRVAAFSVGLASGVGVIEAQLLASVGASYALASGGGRVYGHWVVTASGDAGYVAHYDELPDFAAPPVDHDARLRTLRALVAHASSSPDGVTLARGVALVPKGCGLVATFSPEYGGRLALGLSPAMPALALAEALGWRDVAGRCYTVHQTDWLVHCVTTGADGDTLTVLPTAGRWTVRAALDRRPTGGAIATRGPSPLGGIHALAPADLVRSMSITGGT